MAIGRPQIVESARCTSGSGKHEDTMHMRIVRDPPFDVMYCKICGALGPVTGQGRTTLVAWTAPTGLTAETFHAAELAGRPKPPPAPEHIEAVRQKLEDMPDEELAAVHAAAEQERNFRSGPR